MSELARFFLQAGQLEKGRAYISGDDAHHIIRVLRLQPGDVIECVAPDGQVHLVQISELGSTVVGMVKETLECSQESPLQLTLFQGLAKGDKMDWVIQKAVELGVQEIVPFSSRYTVVKLEPKQAKARHERWQRIALEAAKQCGRTQLPNVHGLHSFTNILDNVKERHLEGGLILLAYEGEKKVGLRGVEGKPEAVSVIVGPEGGFAPEEVQELTLQGAKVCSLGPRILRTETAGLVALSLLGYKWGDLG